MKTITVEGAVMVREWEAILISPGVQGSRSEEQDSDALLEYIGHTLPARTSELFVTKFVETYAKNLNRQLSQRIRKAINRAAE
jgi:hypothetical protein